MEKVEKSLTIVIPAFNEALCIIDTLENISKTLDTENINYTILVVNDNSTDNTEDILKNYCCDNTNSSYVNNEKDGGFGSATGYGLEKSSGDVVAIMMADNSDCPQDLISYYNIINDGDFNCAFGSRFIPGGKVENYPFFKLILNRLFNNLVQLLLWSNYNDFTNAFKAYDREILNKILPISSKDFAATLELSLMAIKNRCRYKIIPIKWKQRDSGVSKLNIYKNSFSYFSVLTRYYHE